MEFETKSTIVNLKYKTYMNIVAITPPLMVHYLQTLNTKFNTERIITTTNDVIEPDINKIITNKEIDPSSNEL